MGDRWRGRRNLPWLPSSWIVRLNGSTVLCSPHFPLQWGNSGKLDIGEGINGWWPAPEGKQQRYPELEELASWFHRALTGAGYRSVNEFLSRGLFEKNAVYGVFGAARLLTLESTQALAVALKRTPAQVVPIWTRAKEARDRATLAAERAQVPRVTSWAKIPLPSLALHDLLEAQCASVERLPYELLDVEEPPLSSVYVRQQMRVRMATDRSERENAAVAKPAAEEFPALIEPRAAVSVLTALEQHTHLLVTGEPGAGKSTMSS